MGLSIASLAGQVSALRQRIDRPAVRLAGAVLVVGVSATFLFRAVMAVGTGDIAARLASSNPWPLIGCALAYGLMLTLLARAWSLALQPDGTPRWRDAIGVYGASVLPKYVPGSVLQYLSRQVLGARMGWSNRAMAEASLLEILLHILCSGGIGIAMAAPWLGGLTGSGWQIAALGGAAVLALTTIAALAALRRFRWPILARAALLQGLFFVGMALLSMAAAAIFGAPPATLLPLGGLFLISWLAGFLFPVAPGGLGVREVAGIGLMSALVAPEIAILVQAAMRLVTLAGDGIAFLIALAISSPGRLAAGTGKR